jgi:MFS family permease
MSLQAHFQYKKLQDNIQQQNNRLANLESHGSGAYNPSSSHSHDVLPIQMLNVDKSVDTNFKSSDYIIVQFDGDDDKDNPKNWSFAMKFTITSLALCAGISGGWASSNDSTIIPQALETFKVSDVTESLATGLYLVTFGLGSLLGGPFSETVGRTTVYIVALLLLMICIMVSGLAPNIGVQLTFRCLAGIFGCTAVTTFAGTVADLWSPTERANAMTIPFAINFCSVFLAPVVGSFIGQSDISWRWTEWLALIIAGVSVTLIFLFSPETYAPIILSWKASITRKKTGNQQYRSSHEISLDPLWLRLARSTVRPFDMLLHELSVVLSLFTYPLFTSSASHS